MASRAEKGMTMDEVSTSFDSNTYATKKTIANSVLNLSLLITTVTQLKEVVDDKKKTYRDFLLALLVVSILIQATIGLGLATMAFLNINKTTKKEREKKKEEFKKKMRAACASCMCCIEEPEASGDDDGGSNGTSNQPQPTDAGGGGSNGTSSQDEDRPTPQQRDANITNYAVLVSSMVLLGVIVFIDIFGEFNTEIPPPAAATTTVAATG